ncbi:MAG: lysophospholipid acyltransferase family protein [Nitrospirota bacterium]
MKKAVWLFEAGLFIVLSIPLAILPSGCSIKVGEMLGILLFHLWGSRRRVALENLKNTVSNSAIKISEPAEKVIRDNFKNIGRSFIEIIKVYYGFGKKIINSVGIEGAENFNHAKSKGRGVVFLTGHCGNWELLAIVLSIRLSGIAVVARAINNPYINKLIENTRQRYGNSVIYKRGALKPIIQTLKNNGVVGILMDQAVVPEEGYVIDFLGRGAWTTKMPALISRKTGTAALPVFIHRTGTGHKIIIHPAVELTDTNNKEKAVIEDTKRFSAFIEEYIQGHPSEWLWIHRRWKRVNSNQ